MISKFIFFSILTVEVIARDQWYFDLLRLTIGCGWSGSLLLIQRDPYLYDKWSFEVLFLDQIFDRLKEWWKYRGDS